MGANNLYAYMLPGFASDFTGIGVAAKAEVIREKGTNRNAFLRGEVDKYSWVDLGSSFLPSDILAAILYAQLEYRERIQLKRRRVWEYYHARLSGWSEEHGIRLPVIPAHCWLVWWSATTQRFHGSESPPSRTRAQRI